LELKFDLPPCSLVWCYYLNP